MLPAFALIFEQILQLLGILEPSLATVLVFYELFNLLLSFIQLDLLSPDLLFDLGNFGLLGIDSGLRLLILGIHLSDPLLLGDNILQGLRVLPHVVAPLGESTGGLITLLDTFHRPDALVVDNLADCIINLWIDIVLFVLLDSIDEANGIHVFLSVLPLRLFVAKVDHYDLESEHDLWSGLLDSPQLLDVFIAEFVYSGFSLLQGRLGLPELVFSIFLDQLDALGFDINIRGLSKCFLLLHLGVHLLLDNDFLLSLGLLLLLSQLGLEVFELDLEHFNLFFGLLEVCNTRLESIDLAIVVHLHFLQVLQVQIDGIKETLWGDVGLSPQLHLEFEHGSLDRRMHHREQFTKCFLA